MQVFATWYLNHFLYPVISNVFPVTRDIGSVIVVTALIIFALTQYKIKHHLNFALLTGLSILFLLIALIILFIGVKNDSTVLVTVGAGFRSLANTWIFILLGLALCSLNNKQCVLAITLALALGFLLRLLIFSFNLDFGYVLIALSSLIVCVCSYMAVKSLNIKQSSESIEVMSMVQPNTSISLNHKLFLAIFIFRLAFGFAIVFGAIYGTPAQSLSVYLIVLIVMIAFSITPTLNIDRMYLLSALFILSGYLFSMVFINYKSSFLGVSNSLLIAGSEIFDALIWIVLSRAARQNMSNAIFIVAWGRMSASLAVLIGANAGHLINYYGILLYATLCIAIIIFIFVAFNLIVLRDFSFERTIAGIHEIQELDINNIVVENFDNKIAVASENYQLTPRESEVYGLMVKGRNAGYIYEELGISINTVKSHVSNIYKKLDVHSQQELIDQFEELDKI